MLCSSTSQWRINFSRMHAPLAWLLIAVQLWQPSLALADVVPLDGSSSAPSMDQAANGMPVVNITAPKEGGLSHNYYSSFDVGPNGVVLNNSPVVTSTKLAGHIEGNPNLTKGSASLILNEVVSVQPTYMLGYVEVAGQRADVVVANPFGITCDGCGFINTHRASLTTGISRLDAQGHLLGFDVSDGHISLEGAGANLYGVDQFDVIARSVSLNAELYGEAVNLITGNQFVDYASLDVAEQRTDATSPTLAIDSTALGGIYAGRIRLVSGESGVGVNLDAPIAAQTGDVQISAQGDLSYSRISASQDIAVETSGSIQGNGSATVGNNIVFDAASISLDVGIVEAEKITVRTHELNVSTNAAMDARHSIVVDAEHVSNAGSLASGGDIQIEAISLENTAGVIAASSMLDIQVDDFIYQGSMQADERLRVRSEQNVVIDAESEWRILGDVELSAGGIFDNSGLLSSAGTLAITANSFLNKGDLAGFDAVHIAADNINNAENSLIFSKSGMTIYGNTISNYGDIFSIEAMQISANAEGEYAQRIENISGLIATFDGDMRLSAEEIINTRLPIPDAVYSLDPGVKYFYNPITNVDGAGSAEESYNERCFLRSRENGCHGKTAHRFIVSRQRAELPFEPLAGRIISGQSLFVNAESFSNQYSSVDVVGNIHFDVDVLENIDYSVEVNEILRHDWSWYESHKSGLSSSTRWYTYVTLEHYQNEGICSNDRIACYIENPQTSTPSASGRPSPSAIRSHRTAPSITQITNTQTLLSASISAGGDIVGAGAILNQGGVAGHGQISIEDTITASGGPSTSAADPLYRFDPLDFSFTLPGDHGLFVMAPPDHLYLIETNPLFADYDRFIGSTYMLDRLGWDADGQSRLLGDGYYEMMLLEQALRGSGRIMAGMDYDAKEQLFTAMMDNAIFAAEDLSLTVGVSLTADQINALQQDIVWMEEKEVAGYKVLVPTVYLAGGTPISAPQASISASNINLDFSEINNSGRITAENNLSAVTSGNLTNNGELTAGHALTLNSGATIDNTAGSISAENVSLIAADNIINSTKTETIGNDRAWVTVTSTQGTISGTHNVDLDAGNSIEVNGGRIDGGRVSLTAGNDILIGTRELDMGWDVGSSNMTDSYSAVRQITSSINSSMDALLSAGDAISIVGAELASNEDIALMAGGDLEILAALEQTEWESSLTQGHSFGGSTKTTVSGSENEWVGSSLNAGGALSMSAVAGALIMHASNGRGEDGVFVDAARGIQIASGVNSSAQRTVKVDTNIARIKTKDSGSVTQSLAAASLSSGAEMTLDTEGSVLLQGASLSAESSLRIGEAAVALDEHGAMRTDDEGELIIERGSAENIALETATLENKSWSKTSREYRGPIKELVKVATVVGAAIISPFTGVLETAPETEIGSSKSTSTHEVVEKGSSLEGHDIRLSAQKNVVLTGANLHADEEDGVVAVLGNNIVLDTAQTITTETQMESVETVGAISGSLEKDEVTLGGVSMTDTSRSTETTTVQHQGTVISGNAIVLNAVDALTLTNADVEATGEDGSLMVDAKSVMITGVQDTRTVTNKETVTVTEVTAGVRNAYVDTAYTIEALKQAGDEVNSARSALKDAERRVDSGELAKDALDDYRVNLVAATANLAQAELAATHALAVSAGLAGSSAGTGFYLSGSAAVSETQTESRSGDAIWQGSKLSAANMFVKADAANIIGSNIDAGFLDLAVQDIDLTAGTNTQTSDWSQTSSTGNANVSSSGDGSWNAGVGYNEASGSSKATQHVNTQLNVGYLQSNSDSLTLAGAVITANAAEINTNTLHVESVQDTHRSENKSSGANLGYGGGASSTGELESLNGGFNVGKGSSEGAMTAQLSGIYISDGENSQITATDTVLIGGLIANAAFDEEGGLTDLGQLNVTTDTLSVTNLRDHSSSEQRGGGMSLSKSTSSFSLQDEGHRMEGETRATLGAGNVVVGGVSLDQRDEFSDLNRDINDAQIVTLDQQTGGLNASVKIDNRMIGMNGGWSDIQDDHTNLLGNSEKFLAGGLSDVTRVGVASAALLSDISNTVKALSTVNQSQYLAYRENGALAGELEGIRRGSTEDAVYAQDKLNQIDRALNGSDGDRVRVTQNAFNIEGNSVAGASSTESNDVYIDMGETSRSSAVNSITHEGMHLAGAGEFLSTITGFAADATYRLNAWANRDEIAAHTPMSVPIANHHAHTLLLANNMADFAGASASGKLEYRQLHKSEFSLVADHYQDYAKDRGISDTQAFKELVWFATSSVDAAHANDSGQAYVAMANDYDLDAAQRFLLSLAAQEGPIVHSDGVSTYAFHATPEQYENSLINRHHLRDIEDGFFGELSGAGRRPLENFAYSGDPQAGGYRDALSLARKEANDAATDQLWMMAAGTVLVPASISLSFAAGAEMLAFGQNPLAYSTILIPRVTPYVDEMAAGLAGFPTGTIFGAGVGTATSKALTYADEAGHTLAPFADDLGHLSGYSRAADDLAVPQLEDMAGDVLRHSDEAVFRFGPDGTMRSVGGVASSILDNGLDLSRVDVLTLKDAKRLEGSNRGLIFVQENSSKSSRAANFENGSTGAFSDILSQRRASPALRFDHPNANGNRTNNFVRFDGVEEDGVTLIDRKISLTSKSDQIRSLQRVSEAMNQNKGFKLVYEFPTQNAADRALDILFRLQITNINIRVVTP